MVGVHDPRYHFFQAGPPTFAENQSFESVFEMGEALRGVILNARGRVGTHRSSELPAQPPKLHGGKKSMAAGAVGGR